MAAGPPFTLVRFGIRWGAAATLLFSTYNPSGVSYYHWVTQGGEGDIALKFMCGAILVWWYMHVLPIVWTSLGPVGIGLTIAILSTGGLVAYDYGLLDRVTPSFYPYVVIMGAATLLAVALSWGHINLQVWYMKLYRKVTPKPR